MPADILKVFGSWLDVRKAVVFLNGAVSEEHVLLDSVFQGTVWGPGLWNTFFADVSEAIRSQGFTEIVFADDLNALKGYDGKTESSVILDEMSECQEQLHEGSREFAQLAQPRHRRLQTAEGVAQPGQEARLSAEECKEVLRPLARNALHRGDQVCEGRDCDGGCGGRSRG